MIPRILVKKNSLRIEQTLFLRFLNHPSFPGHRTLIVSVFPELRDLLDTEKTEQEAVKRFLDMFYKKHRNIISITTKKSQLKIKSKEKEALQNLSELMEYTWKKTTEYIAYPTILPFSPFQKNTFYFSILGDIKKNQENNPLITAIHEISHFIFFEYLKKLHEDMLNSNLIYFLKESLTAMLLDTECFHSIFGIKTYEGNPEIRHMYIKRERKRPVLIKSYIKERYVNRNTFADFLKELIKEFKKNQKEFSKRRVLWNKYGSNIKNNPKLFLQYTVPIDIDKKDGQRSSVHYGK